jgi:hypothetical protein
LIRVWIILHQVKQLVVAHQLIRCREWPLAVRDPNGQDAVLLHIPHEVEHLWHQAVCFGIGDLQVTNIFLIADRKVAGIHCGVFFFQEFDLGSQGRGQDPRAKPRHQIWNKIIVDGRDLLVITLFLKLGHDAWIAVVPIWDQLLINAEQVIERAVDQEGRHVRILKLEGGFGLGFYFRQTLDKAAAKVLPADRIECHTLCS